MNALSQTLTPGTLILQAREASQRALATRRLMPIETSAVIMTEGPMRFVVRMLTRRTGVAHARQKAHSTVQSATGERNPFLPYEPAMFVADLSSTHVCLLNKFTVVDDHLIVVTRAFEEQTSLLTPEDFAAALVCLREFDGLGFYNAGTIAGASQRHKHLQYVPLPLAYAPDGLPIEAPIAQAPLRRIATAPELWFRHKFVRFEGDIEAGSGAAFQLWNWYIALLLAAGIRPDANMQQSAPYNLLFTRRWMLIAPRCTEGALGISVNSLGFAGSLLVRNPTQLALLARYGPHTLLCDVTGGRPPTH